MNLLKEICVDIEEIKKSSHKAKYRVYNFLVVLIVMGHVDMYQTKTLISLTQKK